MATAESYKVFRVFKRVYETRVLTEEGAFTENAVPEDYGGAELKVQITQRIIMTNSTGEILELRFDSLDNVMDDQRLLGLGYQIEWAEDDTEVVLPIGPSAMVATWHVELNTALPSEVVGLAEVMYSVLRDKEGV